MEKTPTSQRELLEHLRRRSIESMDRYSQCLFLNEDGSVKYFGREDHEMMQAHRATIATIEQKLAELDD
jgi:non-ribosomal peptide synthetase component F